MTNDELKKKKMKCLLKHYNYLSCGDRSRHENLLLEIRESLITKHSVKSVEYLLCARHLGQYASIY